MEPPPNFNLAGRVALITGAARGIGLAIAQAFASAGGAVAIHDLDLDEAGRQADAIRNAGRRAIALGGDVTDLSIAPKLVADTVEQLGGVHILINNAGVQARMHWTKVDRGDFDRTMHANVLFPVLLCQRVEPVFRKQKWGRIVHVGSIQQAWGNEEMLSYAMSKAALVNMTAPMARDLGPDGITVNLIAPGYFDTERNKSALGTPEGKRRAGDWLPLKRVGEPDDCAGLALLLCSDAGAYITGQTIYVDGGMLIK